MATSQALRKTPKMAQQQQPSNNSTAACYHDCKNNDVTTTTTSNSNLKKQQQQQRQDVDDEVSTTCSYSESTSFFGDSFSSTIAAAGNGSDSALLLAPTPAEAALNTEQQQQEALLLIDYTVPLNDVVDQQKEQETDGMDDDYSLLVDYTVALNDTVVTDTVAGGARRSDRIRKAAQGNPMKQDLLLDAAYTDMMDDERNVYDGDTESVAADDDVDDENDEHVEILVNEMLRMYLSFREEKSSSRNTSSRRTQKQL